MNPNSNLEIQGTLLPSHNGNGQSIWRSRRRSNEFLKKQEDSRVKPVTTYRQVKSPPGGSLPRHTPASLPWSPTDKSKVRREASLPSWPSSYWRRSPRGQPWSRPDGHRSRTPKTIAVSMPLTMTTGCEIDSSKHAEALHRAQTALARLDLVSITIFREAHLLDINEWDETTWLTETIDDYRLLRPMSAAEAPIDDKSWAEALPPWQIPTMTYSEIHQLRVQYWMAGRKL